MSHGRVQSIQINCHGLKYISRQKTILISTDLTVTDCYYLIGSDDFLKYSSHYYKSNFFLKLKYCLKIVFKINVYRLNSSFLHCKLNLKQFW